jgi:retron-type reverse transcriptase
MYEELCTYDNLLSAFNKARRGKNQKYYVIKFNNNLAKNLLKIRDELISLNYKPRELKKFILRDPKTRKISKSKFRDRVVHHALINIIGHLFQKEFIYDSYANQIGKGTLNALKRFDYFKRKASKNNVLKCFVLKADIKHYFEEVNHDTLINILLKKIKDEKIIWLIKQILNNELHFDRGANAGTPFKRERERRRRNLITPNAQVWSYGIETHETLKI